MDAEIRELFRIFDKNHDNTISSNEIGKALNCMGLPVSEHDIQEIAMTLDTDGSGKIEYKEFYNFMQEELKKAEDPANQEMAVRTAFRVFDKHGSGFIDSRQLQSAMKDLGEPLSDHELEDMMKGVEVDADGNINYEEFIRMWISGPKHDKSSA
ncbi:calmodulin-A-like isoform X2 [Gigantopelta aegis]|nr:calmodulin-A-like isoform X2 [Gigantopelta aegis]XP_041360738.1 calmodulin-A-like isoform X2 [Gigantopelta aegis]